MNTIIVSLVLAICAVAFADPLAPAYQINGRNNCWWTCGKKTGACPKTCGVGGYCCRRGWAGCNLYLSGVAPVNYHTCVRHYTAYQVNGLNNCWWSCGRKTGLCTKTCGNGGYCCRRGWAGCDASLGNVAPPNFHTCIKYRRALPAAVSLAPAYQVNHKNNCWWSCRTGACAKVCGAGGFCCRKGYNGCSAIMTNVAPNDFHTCIRLFQAYQVNGKNNCWWTCGKVTGLCTKTCGVGGYCCRRGWAGCNASLGGVAPPNYHTCIKYRQA